MASRSEVVVLIALAAACGAGGCVGRCTPEPSDRCWSSSGCEDDSYCGADGHCHALGALGAFCSAATPCANGLLCGPLEHCVVPVGEGGECTFDAECTTGLCNHGYVPEDATLGECHPPSSAGAPCGWGGANDDPNNADVLFAHGCAGGLVCVPAVPALPTTTALDPATSGCSELGTACGYEGACAPAGSVPDGGACLDDSACESGRCVHVTAPHGSETSPLFGQGGSLFAGAWPDRCAPLDAITEGVACGASSTCAPGLYCDASTAFRRCVSWMQRGAGERCGIMDQPSLGSDAECRFGLVCTPSTDGLFCRVPGTDLEGQPCSPESCAPGLGCRAADSICAPLGGVGASCAAGELPCALGLLCDATSHCEQPA